MAEPFNTPVPGATPRSQSPIPHGHPYTFDTRPTLARSFSTITSAAVQAPPSHDDAVADTVADAIADLAVSLVLAVFRHISWSAADDADTPDPRALRSEGVRGKTLGLVGPAAQCKRIAEKLGSPAFGMAVQAYDPAGPEPLDGLLADCIVLCAPASTLSEPLVTQPLVTRNVLAHLRPGSRLVSVPGSLVDADALAGAVESGALSAAAIDVPAGHASPRLRALASRAPGRLILTRAV